MTNKLARIGLQWSLGLVLIYECARLLFSSDSHGPIPHALVFGIGAVELLGSILFLIPPTVKTGGRLLIATFVVAAIVHVLHGQADVGFLAIYGFAVLTVIP
jgi:hypothetical protein